MTKVPLSRKQNQHMLARKQNLLDDDEEVFCELVLQLLFLLIVKLGANILCFCPFKAMPRLAKSKHTCTCTCTSACV